MKNYEKELLLDLIERYCYSHKCNECCFYYGENCRQCSVDKEMLETEIENFYEETLDKSN